LSIEGKQVDETKVILLKHDLQILHEKQDEYLKNLLDMSASMIRREGIELTEDIEDVGLQVMYAAYLYRHRAEKENAMPRMLRYALNNRLLSQKMKTETPDPDLEPGPSPEPEPNPEPDLEPEEVI